MVSNTKNASIFSADAVEQSLRYQLAYSHCQVRIFHSVDGELLAVIHSQLHCTSCTAEVEKLVMLFENQSPQVTLNVPLSVILIAEVVQFVQLHPSDSNPRSSAAHLLAAPSPPTHTIPPLILLGFIYLARRLL